VLRTSGEHPMQIERTIEIQPVSRLRTPCMAYAGSGLCPQPNVAPVSGAGSLVRSSSGRG
jgi:hypothetical protein